MLDRPKLTLEIRTMEDELEATADFGADVGAIHIYIPKGELQAFMEAVQRHGYAAIRTALFRTHAPAPEPAKLACLYELVDRREAPRGTTNEESAK